MLIQVFADYCFDAVANLLIGFGKVIMWIVVAGLAFVILSLAGVALYGLIMLIRWRK